MTNLFKFYYDLLSPSSRSLLILLDIAKVPCEKVSVALRKGEHLGLDFAQHVNRFNKIPAINHDGFRLSESVAIYHYLGRSTILPVQWYPGGTDLQKQTRIDEYLEWQQNNLFINAGMIFLQAWALPFISGKLPDDKLIQRLNRVLSKCVDDLENIWLKSNKFLAGDEASIADLTAGVNLEQVIGLKLFSLDNVRHPKVYLWLEATRQEFNPSFNIHHSYVYKYGEKFNGKPPI